jgi:hypothetical protein
MKQTVHQHVRANAAGMALEVIVRANIHERVCDALGTYLEEMNVENLKRIAAVKQPTEIISKILQYQIEQSLIKNKLKGAVSVLKGLQDRMELLNSEGGAISSSQVASLLGLSRQAVDNRRKKSKLLAVYLDGRNDYFYPVWQFGESGIKKNFEKILANLEHLDPWMKLVFWLSKNNYLRSERPLDALKDDEKMDLIIRAAKMTGEQGGQ